ncbi:sigma factor-like helix-turn-helix DNA-binding protein [Thermoactinomyces sp. CICC 10522]|uniref:sigma factor-like helix-turn-helix DNA-binding protein n=1 Tax=Thermoactinomyces sp. CICC 10522 TaxID=2767427 RepID=UPI0018DE8AAD|nr:sigma factor-like helix-turn-helix DNA-binding protein [Thermoactinomyces sp. CICC 10522]MBH8603671.1 helix-turn-helix domain-containing protein [Thermoactinomyces sp. CICC 10522]
MSKYDVIFGAEPKATNEAVSEAFKEYNKRKSYAQEIEEEIDRCMGAPADWYEYELKKLIYPLDMRDNVNFETGKTKTKLAAAIMSKVRTFVKENTDLYYGNSLGSDMYHLAVEDVGSRVAAKVGMIIHNIYEGKFSPDAYRKGLTYFYLERAIRNEFTEITREIIRKNGGKVERGIKSEELTEGEREELTRIRRERKEKRRHAEEVYKEQERARRERENDVETQVINKITVENMIADQVLTDEERAVLVYMYRNPGASHQEIGDELGINRRTVSRIIQRLGKKLAHHIEE